MSFIINLFGPSAAGKSTIEHMLQERIDNLNVIDFDIIKRQIPNYDWSIHAQAGREMTREKLKQEILAENNILLLMPSPKNQEEFDLVRLIAEAQNYKLLNVEITAPDEVLIERYAERLANIDPAKKGWKFKTLDEFKAKLQEPYYIPGDTASFDSSLNSPEDIASSIADLTSP